jgi:NAD+-dependent protein deacetylase sirtuin 4
VTLRTLAPLPRAMATDPAIARAMAPLCTAFAASTYPVIVSGAGISTESGIPDYRSPSRPAYKPINHNDFLTHASTRRRYWARSMLGWDRMALSAPNAGHIAVARLLTAGRLGALITQNVDRLHHRALALASAPHAAAAVSPIIELHGTIHEVVCLSCGQQTPRTRVQEALLAWNSEWRQRWLSLAAPRPDGDVELPPESYESFVVPTCAGCGVGPLKPDVVFHGGTLPDDVRAAAHAAAARADFLLLAGTTVTTHSAFRLVRDAAARGARLAIVNYGVTRADALLSGQEWKVEAHTSSCLTVLADLALHAAVA